MTKPLLLERAGTGAGRADVLLADGRVAAAGPGAAADPRAAGADRLDLDGYLLLPSAVEPHAHLDKALLARRAPNPAGDLDGAITAIRAAYASMDEADLLARSAEALTTAVANGYTAVRSHADVNEGLGTRAVRALLRLRERSAGLVDLQVVALTGAPVAGAAGRHNRRLLAEALAAGADAVGGVPALDPDPRAAVGVLVRAAADAGLPLDVHADETTDASMLTLRHLASEVARHGLGGRATASHCVSLGQQDPGTARDVARALADAGVAVVTLPQTNLYLQGRGHPTRTPRGLTAVAALRAAGVTVAGGGDNWRDPFNPLGRIDPFETASLLVAAAHLTPADAYAAVSARSRAALGLPAVDLAPGSPADLLAIRASGLDEAVAAAPADRIVIRGGVVVARTRVVRDIVPTLDREEVGGRMTIAEGRRLLRLEVRNAETPIEKKPEWIRVRAHMGPEYRELTRLVKSEGLHTVCQEAGCPNIYECWEDREATFLIGGDQCTRRCDFCQIDTGKPAELDRDEPRRVAESVAKMGLRYATITGVARDDLEDGGSWLYAETVRQIHAALPGCGVELLIPDFNADPVQLAEVFGSRPEVLAHNLETVPRIFKRIRPGFRYERSLEVITRARADGLVTKSNLILGMGETRAEVSEALRDLHEAGCELITITQYLRPTPRHHPVERWVKPEEFVELSAEAEEIGYAGVMSGPLVRSSYRAGRLYQQAISARQG